MRLKLLSAFPLVLIMLFTISLATMACLCIYTPTIIAIDANHATNIETITATITGTKFYKNSQVKLRAGGDEIVASNVQFKSKTEIVCTLDLNGKAVGQWDVVVINPKNKTAKLIKGFTIEYPAPIVSSIQPKEGVTGLVVPVTITGQYFRNGAVAKLLTAGPSEILINKVIVNSTGKISGQIDLKNAKPGSYDLRVTNDDGKSGTLANAFTVQPAPVVTPVVVTPVVVTPVDPNTLLKPIFFDFDKYNLRSDQTATAEGDLTVLKDYLASHAQVYVVLGGHADERGSQKYNIQLSLQRANTIKDYLVAEGIASERLVVYAYGEDFPARLGHDEDSWWYNRRVDIAVWEMKPSQSEALQR